MKKRYNQPRCEVYELCTECHVMDTSHNIPGGGEIPIGGRGSLDASSRRSGWEDYEQ